MTRQRLSDRSTAKRAFLSVLVFLGSVFLVFGSAETYVRITQPNVDLDVLTGRRAVEDDSRLEWARIDAFSAYVPAPGDYSEGKTVNSLGHISTPPLTVEKEDGTIRLLFLGGSSTAGTGHNLQDEQTWPWITHKLLTESLSGRIVEFINGASGGYTTFESFGRLWSRLRFFSPDIIVVNHGWNEMYHFNKAHEIEEWRTIKGHSWGFTKRRIKTVEPLWLDQYISRSQFLTRLRLMLSPSRSGEVTDRQQFRALRTTYDRSGVDVYRFNLRLLRETAVLLGAKLFVIKQPTLITPGLSPVDRARCRYDFHGFNHDAHVDAFNEIYRVIDEEIEPARIIDLTHLNGVSELFNDHVHPTTLGARKIASLVARSLQDDI